MKLKNLQIENYRSIESLSIDFHDRLNVFVGANGAGKSTLLDAISTSLSYLIRRIENPNRTGLSISYEDIRNGTDASLICCQVEEEEKFSIWQITKANKGRKSIYKSDYSELNQLVEHFQQELKDKNQLPVVCSYPISREVEKINPKYDTNGVSDIFKAYERALDGRRDYKVFFEWFRSQEDILNQESNSINYLFEKNVEWIKLEVQKLVNILRDLLFVFEKDDYLFAHYYDSLEDESTFKNPSYLFADLNRLFSAASTGSDELFKTILTEVQYVFHLVDLYSRSNYYEDEKGAKQSIEDNLRLAILKLTDLQKQVNVDDKKVKLQWDLLQLSYGLAFWWKTADERLKLNNVLLKIRNQEVNPLFGSTELKIRLLKEDIIPLLEKEEREGREIKIIKQTIERLLPEYSNLRVKRHPKPQMLIDKDGETFSMDQLSDGEKNIIVLISDIARRLTIANPRIENPLEGNGIILIDEVDLHLHPAWQRLVIPKLLEFFPNCQFFISTHSPQVVSHVKPYSLFLLRNMENRLTWSQATESYGKTSDRILEDLLEVDARPSEEKERLKALFRMIDAGELEKAKKELERLDELIVGGEPELAKARVLIKRKEIIGR